MNSMIWSVGRSAALALVIGAVGLTATACTAADRAVMTAPTCSGSEASPSIPAHEPGQAVLMGNLGRGTFPTGPIPGWEQVISVAHTGSAAAAVHPDGTVSVAGADHLGSLAGTGDAAGQAPEPRPVDGVTGAVSVAAVGSAFLVTHRDGTVTGWGESFIASGGARTSGRDQPVPRPVPGVEDVVMVADGALNALALRSDGTVLGWGTNFTDILGDTDGTLVRAIDDVTGAMSIANSGSAGVIATGTGEVCAWGNNVHGLLGVEPRGGQSAKVVRVEGLEGIEQVAAGSDIVVARDSEGAVWSWGRHAYGLPGAESTEEASLTTPRRVPGLPPVRWVGAAGSGVYGIDDDGGLWAWGGSLRLEPFTTDSAHPQLIPLAGPASEISGRVVLLGPTD